MEEKIYFASDLSDSGPLVQMVFSIDYPDGLTLTQMEESEHPYLHRAAKRIREGGQAHG